jgi:prophage antirepressor-like protein
VLIEGEPWFVAADVCRALGLPFGKGAGSTARYLGNLAVDEKRAVTKVGSIGSTLLAGTAANSANLVSESGLYKLIMRSDKPEAAAFQDWVTREVLPAIRKTGGYLLNEEARETAAVDQRETVPIPQDFPAALRALADALERPLTEGFDNPMQSWGNLSTPISPHP